MVQLWRDNTVLSALAVGLILALLTGETCVSASAPVVAVPASISSPAAASKKGRGNPVTQLAGFVRDSVVRTKDGIGQLYRNHQTCNEIREKQNVYKNALKAAWKEDGLNNKEINQRAKLINGGITYQEYDYLVKGKEDRGKMTQLAVMMVAAPKFLPYAMMFFPEMMPGPFAAQPVGEETPWEAISRVRSHTVISTLLAIEKGARLPPSLSKLNPFGRNGANRAMEQMQNMGLQAASLLVAPGADKREGAGIIMDALRKEYLTESPTKPEVLRLSTVPKAIVKGLSQSIEAKSGASFDFILPTFLIRGRVINHLKKISDADDFLVKEGVDLTTLNTELLTEACRDRLIGGPRRTDEEMKDGLEQWLELVVTQPETAVKTKGLHYNGNLARTTLMCYNALDGVRDMRSASYLPRLLFQGQLGKDDYEETQSSSTTRKKRYLYLK